MKGEEFMAQHLGQHAVVLGGSDGDVSGVDSGVVCHR